MLYHELLDDLTGKRMDLYIFVDVSNPEMDAGQVWPEEQCEAVYRALCLFEGVDFIKSQHRLKQFIQDECIGASFSIQIEYHRGDKRNVDDVLSEANVIYDYLQAECKDVGLVVSQHSSV